MFSLKLYRLFADGQVNLQLIQAWQEQSGCEYGSISLVKLFEKRFFWQICTFLGSLFSFVAVVCPSLLFPEFVRITSFVCGVVLIGISLSAESVISKKYRLTFLKDLKDLSKLCCGHRIGCMSISELKEVGAKFLVNEACRVIQNETWATNLKREGKFEDADHHTQDAVFIKRDVFKPAHSLFKAFGLVDNEWTHYFEMAEENMSRKG